jgi:hypothetical protein
MDFAALRSGRRPATTGELLQETIWYGIREKFSVQIIALYVLMSSFR